MGPYGGVRLWIYEQGRTGFLALESASCLCVCGSRRVHQRHEHHQHTRRPEQQRRMRLQELQQRRRRKCGGDSEQQVEGRQSQKHGGLLLHARKEPLKGGICVSGHPLPGECRGGAAHFSTVSFVLWLTVLFLLVWETRLSPSGYDFSAGALALESRHYDHPQVLTSPLKRQPKEEKRDLLPNVSVAKGEQSFAESLLSSAAAREPWPTEAPAPPVPFQGTEEIYEMRSRGTRLLALGDVHGDMHNTLLVLSAAGLVNPETWSWTGGDATLVQTGDILDRGDKGIQLLEFFKRLSQEARAAGGMVLQLLGNHEMMNICGFFQYANPSETAVLGGLENRRRFFQFGTGHYGKMLASFLAAVKVDDIVFSHAGITPPFAKLGLRELTRRLRAELTNDCEKYKESLYNPLTAPGAPLVVSGPDGPLWTRAFARGTLEEICPVVDESLQQLKATRMVMGHNVQSSHHIETYCRGKLVAIDTGLSSFVSNSPTMLEIRYARVSFEWSVIPPPRPLFGMSTLLAARAMSRTRPLVSPPKEGEGPSTSQPQGATSDVPEKASTRPLVESPTHREGPSTSQAQGAASSLGPPPQRGTLAPGGESLLWGSDSTSRPQARSMGEERGLFAKPATLARQRSTSTSEYGGPSLLWPSLPSTPITTSTHEERRGEEMLPRRSPPPSSPPRRRTMSHLPRVPLPMPPRPPLPESLQPSEPPKGWQWQKGGASKRDEL